MKIKLTLLISVIALFAVTSYSQVYQKAVQDTERGRIVKTTSSRMVGAKSFSATQYCLKGRTASGEMVRNGIIAADPRVLPLGTKVLIQGLGTFIVKDTGGAIKGQRLDIWTSSCSSAIKFGRKTVQLIVL